ncbi:MAG: carboxypeptidase-like regulatory domain-containing protein, partial [Chloroflexota bacterium]
MAPVLVASLVVAASAVPALATSITGVQVRLPKVSAGGFTVAGAVEDGHGNPIVGADAGLCTAIDGCFAAETISGPGGTFTIQGVPAGSYFLKVYPPEGQNLQPSWYPGSTGGTIDPGSAAMVDVHAHTTGLTVHLVDGYRITGHVKTPGGDPAEGVSIVASGGGSGIPSDAAGFYQVVGLPAGPTQLLVRGPESGPLARQIPNGTVIDGLEVPEGGDPGTTYDTSIGDLTNQDITIVVGRSISGHVAGSAGLAVGVSGPGANPAYEAIVDGSGNFTVTGLYPGTSRLWFEVPGTVPGATNTWGYGYYAGPSATLTSAWADAAEVDTTAGDVTGLEAVLPTFPSISGTVRNVNGPVAGATVRVCGGSGTGCAYASSNGSGVFHLQNVPPD